MYSLWLCEVLSAKSSWLPSIAAVEQTMCGGDEVRFTDGNDVNLKPAILGLG